MRSVIYAAGCGIAAAAVVLGAGIASADTEFPNPQACDQALRQAESANTNPGVTYRCVNNGGNTQATWLETTDTSGGPAAAWSRALDAFVTGSAAGGSSGDE